MFGQILVLQCTTVVNWNFSALEKLEICLTEIYLTHIKNTNQLIIKSASHIKHAHLYIFQYFTSGWVKWSAMRCECAERV